MRTMLSAANGPNLPFNDQLRCCIRSTHSGHSLQLQSRTDAEFKHCGTEPTFSLLLTSSAFLLGKLRLVLSRIPQVTR